MIFGVPVCLCPEEEHACVLKRFFFYMTDLEVRLEPRRCFHTKSHLFLDFTSGSYFVLISTCIQQWRTGASAVCAYDAIIAALRNNCT